MTDPFRCPHCGATAAGADPVGLCPACLFGLAFDTDSDDEPDDDPSVPGPAYRVLTVLSSEHDRTTYLAEQDQTRRLVTLDVVRVPVEGGDDIAVRCRRRLRELMRWVHSGAPRVIDGRRSPSGDFCVVSHYVSGQRLDRYCDARHVDLAGRARLFAELCDIVAAAHRSGIQHGRLRPDLVVAAASGGEVHPVVLGYSVTPGRVPTTGEDLAGLEGVARAMGWQGPREEAWASIDQIRAAVCGGWM
jgi:hypothetical protein